MPFYSLSASSCSQANMSALPLTVRQTSSLSICICLVFLLTCAFWDIRTLTIPIPCLITGGISALILNVWLLANGKIQPLSIPVSLMPGLLLLLISWLTCQKIGYGDGLCFLVTGLLLGSRVTFLILLISLLLISILSIFLLLFRKGTWEANIPFLPFVFAGFLITAAGGYI